MTTEQHPPLTPLWKKEPCLGCGQKVKRHRGLWVEVVGTLSGSWLVAMPTEAGRGVSTDSDALPTEDIFMLGAAHRDCLDGSFRRIIAGEVAFAGAGLCKAAVETIQPEEVPPLHLPSGSADCLFCDRLNGSRLTDEHIWPEWLQKQLVARGARFPQYGRGRETSPMGPKARACHDCNTRWMSVLEEDTKPLVVDMWDHRRILDPHDQEVLATWAMKMVVLFDGSTPTPLIPRGFPHDLRVGRRPQSGVWVWASGFVGPTHQLSAWLRPLRLVPRGGLRPDQPNALCVTFTVYRVLFQVVVTFYRGIYDLAVTSDLSPLLTALWPLDGESRLWPAGGFDFEAVEVLAERIDDGAGNDTCWPDFSTHGPAPSGV